MATRLNIKHKPCKKNARRSQVATQAIRISHMGEDPNTLIIFIDSSRTEKGTRYTVLGYHKDKLIFSHSIPFGPKASNHDAEMFALTHAAIHMKRWLRDNVNVSRICFFSNSSALLKSIFNGSPHPAQAASILFRENIKSTLEQHLNLKIFMEWTPGHRGLAKMNNTDKEAKKAVNSKGPFFFNHTSLLEVLQNLELNALKRWRSHHEDNMPKPTSWSYHACQD
jgi:ribonuclease HI